MIGRNVGTFSDATHAVIADMSLNADYAFMLPKVVRCDAKTVTLGEGGKEITATIRTKRGLQCCMVEQRGAYEQIFGVKAAKCWFYPFKQDAR